VVAARLYLCVAVGADVDGIAAAGATRHVTGLSLFPLLPMLSTWAPQETTRSLCSLVHLFPRFYFMVAYILCLLNNGVFLLWYAENIFHCTAFWSFLPAPW